MAPTPDRNCLQLSTNTVLGLALVPVVDVVLRFDVSYCKTLLLLEPGLTVILSSLISLELELL